MCLWLQQHRAHQPLQSDEEGQPHRHQVQEVVAATLPVSLGCHHGQQLSHLLTVVCHGKLPSQQKTDPSDPSAV